MASFKAFLLWWHFITFLCEYLQIYSQTLICLNHTNSKDNFVLDFKTDFRIFVKQQSLATRGAFKRRDKVHPSENHEIIANTICFIHFPCIRFNRPSFKMTIRKETFYVYYTNQLTKCYNKQSPVLTHSLLLIKK